MDISRRSARCLGLWICISWLNFIDFQGHVPILVAAGSDDPIPDKVGAEVRLTKKERGALKKLECPMCKAIIREMHVEVQKHKMVGGGWGSESQVWETANAICLALLQKYRLTIDPPSLKQKPEGEDDEEYMAKAGPAAGMQTMLVLKMGCQHWVEDYGGDTSGFVYKAVRDGTHSQESAADDFCTQKVDLCGINKKDKQKQLKAMERQRRQERARLTTAEEQREVAHKEKDMFKNLPEDSKLGIQRMLELAKDDPLHYMDSGAQERVHKARVDLRCSVCQTVLGHVHGRVSQQPKSMRREYDIMPFVEGVCEGGKDLSVPNYFGVEPPPLPALWTDHVRPRFSKKNKRWDLGKFPRKAAKERQKWRKLSEVGKQKPPPASEGEGDMMLTMACKDMLEPERMAEALFTSMAICEKQRDVGAKPCNPVLQAAHATCRSAEGAPCTADSNDKRRKALDAAEL